MKDHIESIDPSFANVKMSYVQPYQTRQFGQTYCKDSWHWHLTVWWQVLFLKEGKNVCNMGEWQCYTFEDQYNAFQFLQSGEIKQQMVRLIAGKFCFKTRCHERMMMTQEIQSVTVFWGNLKCHKIYVLWHAQSLWFCWCSQNEFSALNLILEVHNTRRWNCLPNIRCRSTPAVTYISIPPGLRNA